MSLPGETLEGVYIVKQIAQALPHWERAGQVGRQKIPVVRTAVTNTPSKALSRSRNARYIVSEEGNLVISMPPR